MRPGTPRPSLARRTLESYPFHCELQTRLADLDLGRHVNNATIAAYHEEVRVRMFADLMGLATVLERDSGGGVIAHVSIDYLREVFYGTPVTGCVALASFGRTSYALAQALFQHGVCVSVCDTVIAWREAGKAAPPPADLKERLTTVALRPE